MIDLPRYSIPTHLPFSVFSGKLLSRSLANHISLYLGGVPVTYIEKWGQMNCLPFILLESCTPLSSIIIVMYIHTLNLLVVVLVSLFKKGALPLFL